VKGNVQNFSVSSHPVKTYKACIRLTGHDIKNDGMVKRERKFKSMQKIHLGGERRGRRDSSTYF
jgi:hypothetical protein